MQVENATIAAQCSKSILKASFSRRNFCLQTMALVFIFFEYTRDIAHKIQIICSAVGGGACMPLIPGIGRQRQEERRVNFRF